jgi:hypothetical protein
MPTMRMHRSKLRNHVAWNNIWIYYAVVTILHSQALSNRISLNLSSYQTANMQNKSNIRRAMANVYFLLFTLYFATLKRQ